MKYLIVSLMFLSVGCGKPPAEVIIPAEEASAQCGSTGGRFLIMNGTNECNFSGRLCIKKENDKYLVNDTLVQPDLCQNFAALLYGS